MLHEVLRDQNYPSDWRVEAINIKEGDVYIAIFTGPESEKRAKEYSSWKNKEN